MRPSCRQFEDFSFKFQGGGKFVRFEWGTSVKRQEWKGPTRIC